MVSKCGNVVAFEVLSVQNVELSSFSGFWVLKTCNCRLYRLFWDSKEIGSCQSVELSSLLWFLGSIGSLVRVVAGCFFFSHGFWVRICRTVVTIGVLGLQNV